MKNNLSTTIHRIAIIVSLTLINSKILGQCSPPSSTVTVNNEIDFLTALNDDSKHIQIANNTDLQINLNNNYYLAFGKQIILPSTSSLILDGQNIYSISNSCSGAPGPKLGGGFILDGGHFTLKNITIKNLENFLQSSLSYIGPQPLKNIIIKNVKFQNCSNSIFFSGNFYHWIRIADSEFEWDNNFIPYIQSLNSPNFQFPAHINILYNFDAIGNTWITNSKFSNKISSISHQSAKKGTGINIHNHGLYVGKQWCNENAESPNIPSIPSCPQICGNGNEFNNLFQGIYSKQSHSLTRQVEISNNKFKQCYGGIICDSDYNSFISNNSIEFDGSSELEETLFGIRMIESRNYDILQNTFDIVCTYDVCQGIELLDCDDATPGTPPQITTYKSNINSNQIHYHGSNSTGTTHNSCSIAPGGFYSNSAIGIASYGYNIGANISCNTFDLNLVNGGCPNSWVIDVYLSTLPSQTMTYTKTINETWASGNSPNWNDIGNIFMRHSTASNYGFVSNLPSFISNNIDYYYNNSITNSIPTNNNSISGGLNVNPIMVNNPNNFNLYQPRKTCLRLEGGNQSEGLKIAQKIEEKIEENLKAILI